MSSSNNKFQSLSLDEAMLANLASLSYLEMTPIQAQGLPVVLAGKDILAQAKTGSGKTVAFGLGLLHKLAEHIYQTQALVLCPTRELADQVGNELRRLARCIPNTKIVTLCGGKPIAPQRASLAHDPHIVVGTPGRVLKHLQQNSLVLDGLQTLVLDEADRMLDMGFQEEILHIIDFAPAQRQTLLFAATYPDEIAQISRWVQSEPVEIRVDLVHDHKSIQQIFYLVGKGERVSTLITLIQHFRPNSSVIFCNQKQSCQALANELWQEGFHALALHGDLEQKERDQVLAQFTNKSCSILVATDVAARGLDIDDLDAVINFELSPDPEVHVHRIGRTGRAGNEGLALSLFLGSEQGRVDNIAAYQDCTVRIDKVSTLKKREHFKLSPPMVTLAIQAGRKDKIRAGDILGALTATDDLPGKQIGKIAITEQATYVAVERSRAKQALKILTEGKIKGRKYRVRKLR